MIKKDKFILAVLICFIFIFSLIFYAYYYNQKNFFKINALDSNIVEVQTRLSNWGYYKGQITGVLDNGTKQAIIKFQSANGLTQTGNIDGATANALGVRMTEQNSYDVYLLAKCVYAEARGEIYEGKVAVAAVILNRVDSPEFPNTIYGVIYQPWAFTAVHDGQINLEPDAQAYQAATDALNGWDPTYGCLFYYNPDVATSSWIFNRKTVVTIGKHVFAI